MIKLLFPIIIFLIALTGAARSDEVNIQGFTAGHEIIGTVLSASISSSQVSFSGPGDMSTSHNNHIDSGAFAGSTGIMAIAQNSGANSIVQQSVITKIDALTIGSTSESQ